MSGLAAAIGFLTRLPLPAGAASELRDVALSQAWFPAVGLLIGLALLGVDRAVSRALPPVSVAVLDVVALAVFTGALHLDGLADAADGLFGGHDAAIAAGRSCTMSTPGTLRAGRRGFGAGAEVCRHRRTARRLRFESLLLAPCLARLAMVVAIAAFPYARSEGIGASFHAARGRRGAGRSAAVALVAGGGAAWRERRLRGGVRRRLRPLFGAIATQLVGGMTGDLYGATLEMSEACLLLFFAAFAARGWLAAWLLG